MSDYFGEPETIFDLAKTVFLAAAITCVLSALHRIGNGIALQGRVAAYDLLEDAYTPEEREVLIHKIKANSLSC